MKKFTHFLLVAMVASLAINLASCGNGDKKNSDETTEQQLADKEKELEELRQLAEIDKKEMENQYAEFTTQYDELQKTVKDTALIKKLEKEKAHAEALLAELKKTNATNSAEILRLKNELESVRAVLRDYIRQVDSLQQVNIALTGERDQARAEAEQVKQENSNIQEQNNKLNERVAIAAQLDATGVSITPYKKNGKNAKKSKDITRFGISFAITKNVTARAGNRNVYVRLLKPNQQVVNESGSFSYEGRSIAYSAVKTVEYSGQETRVTLYVPVSEFLSAGKYSAYIFADGQMIGSGSLNLEK